MNEPNDYKYDVFLSYPHGFVEEWVNNHFLPLLTFHLEGAIGRRPEVFFDRTGISAGDSWPARLKQALCCSRCLVAVWSPSYFRSEWCMIECNHIRSRENLEGMRTDEKPSGLIAPVNVSNGKYFPNFAKNIQYFDCRDYMIAGPAFEQSQLYIELQQKIRAWVRDVAEIIENAPEWKQDWLGMPIARTLAGAEPSFEPPVLE